MDLGPILKTLVMFVKKDWGLLGFQGKSVVVVYGGVGMFCRVVAREVDADVGRCRSFVLGDPMEFSFWGAFILCVIEENREQQQQQQELHDWVSFRFKGYYLSSALMNTKFECISYSVWCNIMTQFQGISNYL
jgi:hypothetical protein